MASAGTVTVDFAAETARFTSELRKVNQSIQSVGGQLDGIGKLARNLFAGVSFAAVTSQLTSLISQSLELGGAIADATKKAGISAEAFSQLNFAAKLAGVGTDDLSSAFTKFQKELAGGGEKIASLGVNLEEFRVLQPDRQFEVLAEAIAQIKDPAVRAGAAVEVFGKSGANLLPLFEEGAKGIRAAREEAQRLGITLSTEQANALDSAGDRIDKLKARASDLALILTSDLAKSIEFVTEKLQKLVTPASDQDKELSTLTDQFDSEIKRRRDLLQEVSQLQQRKQDTFVPGLDADFDRAIAEAQQKIRVTDNLLNFLNQKIQRFNIEAEQARQQAQVALPENAIDPSKRTFGTDAAAKAKELADLNRELNAEFNRNSAELGEITDDLLQRQLETFEANEKRKRDIASQYAGERAAIEEQFQEFLRNKAEEELQREQAISDIKVDLVQSGLSLIAAVSAKDAKLQKRISLAQAIINTAQGVTKALASAPPPYSFALAAAVGAAGAAQIARIASTPEAGGGSSVSFGGGPSIGTAPTNPINQPEAQQIQAQQQPAATQIIFNGLITPESKQAIVDVIREATDNDVIVIDQRSAQAQMFMPAQ